MLTEKTFNVGDVSINYVEGPPGGVPLVMLHGVTTRWQVFLPAMPGLLIRYHTFALDLRGHGKSSRTEGNYAVGNDISDVVAFLRSQVKAPAVLLGWSLGAIVALLVAAKEPELVSALILADPPLAALTEDDSSQAGFYTFFRSLREIRTMDATEMDKRSALAALMPGLNDAVLRKRSKHLRQVDPECLTVILEKSKFENYRLDTVLPKIRCPVLLIQGNPELGGALDEQTAKVALSYLNDCAHIYLPDVGHGVHDAQPQVFSQLVSDFLESF